MPLLMEDTSITGRAYHLLRAELISCRLKPGTRLNISSLQKKLSLSQAAVREALSRLTSERSEEHTSELQSLMRISYAVFCLKKKRNVKKKRTNKIKKRITQIKEEKNK